MHRKQNFLSSALRRNSIKMYQCKGKIPKDKKNVFQFGQRLNLSILFPVCISSVPKKKRKTKTTKQHQQQKNPNIFSTSKCFCLLAGFYCCCVLGIVLLWVCLFGIGGLFWFCSFGLVFFSILPLTHNLVLPKGSGL